MQDLKELLSREVIGPIRDPASYQRYGLTLPRGILLYGPPGCGKTYIARCLAQELGFYFVEVLPSSVGSPYIHESSTKIRRKFEEARKQAPAIMFFDEFDALAPTREGLGGSQQYKSEEVNELLAHMNDCAEASVLVIAATNVPQKIDPAVRRSGRLDKLIYVGPPDQAARTEILRHYLGQRPGAARIDAERAAEELSGYSPSDLRLLVDEAARDAHRNSADLSLATLFAAAGRVPPSVTPAMEEAYRTFVSRGGAS